MRRRGGCGGCLFGLVLLLAVPIGASLWLDLAGKVHDGLVGAKHERIWVSDDGDWTRRYELALKPQPGAMLAPTLTVGAADYEALHPGDHVRVRSLDCCPIFGRLADRTTRSWVVETGWQFVVTLRWVLWTVLGIGALVLAYKIGQPMVLLVGAAWIFSATLLPGAYAPRLAPAGDWRPARARVSDLHLIDDILHSRRSRGVHLLQPYYVVELSYLPAGARDTVIAVDAVDSGSVARLGHDSVLAIRYDPRDSRRAVLTAGNRSYPARNRPLYWFLAGVVPAGITALLFFARSRRRAPTDRPGVRT